MKEFDHILSEIQSVLQKVQPEAALKLISMLQSGRTVFLVGEGRSGFMAKSFAMRLHHLGVSVFVVGETITPSIKEGDVLIAVSGSGTSAAVLSAAKKSIEAKAEVWAVTANAESPLAQTANEILHVEAATRYRKEHESKSVQPLGSLFDQCCHIVFDAICLRYASELQVAHSEAFNRHTNL
ncbi:6-phospho-3-hexuloisomerase [Paenibacillus abyssi]|uniref:6-phospho 3-hexuloisomerase n=1 Tax=Paenibacillus abyssi TaxID=1340531 RepID=A0A917D0I8_9BACL|nr:6-phospho-3-hexuloisomerase [Paenibacillus abyssi]GGG03932.1 6-phospho 3-hexuloisomerase [Paenibacillus abyssi]